MSAIEYTQILRFVTERLRDFFLGKGAKMVFEFQLCRKTIILKKKNDDI